MNSEAHNDTAPDSGGGVSAFETMVTEYREVVKVNRWPGPTIGAPQELVYDKNMHHAHNCSVARFNPKGSGK